MISAEIGFTEQMEACGLLASSKTLTAKVVPAEPEIVSRLNLPPSASLVKIERLRLGSNEPFSLETCCLSAERYSGIIKTPLAHVHYLQSLSAITKRRFTYADEEIDVIAADGSMTELIGVAKGSPLLRIRQVIFSRAGNPEIYVFGVYRADRHTFLVRRFR